MNVLNRNLVSPIGIKEVKKNQVCAYYSTYNVLFHSKVKSDTGHHLYSVLSNVAFQCQAVALSRYTYFYSKMRFRLVFEGAESERLREKSVK